MSEFLFSPKQVARELNVASSTLRLWAAHFGPVLSTFANPARTESGSPGRRSFTAEDLRILTRAKELLRDNLTFEQALVILRTEPIPEPEPEPEPETSQALALPSELLNGIAANLALMANQQDQINELRRRLDELEKRQPWYRRLFGG